MRLEMAIGGLPIGLEMAIGGLPIGLEMAIRRPPMERELPSGGRGGVAHGAEDGNRRDGT